MILAVVKDVSKFGTAGLEFSMVQRVAAVSC